MSINMGNTYLLEWLTYSLFDVYTTFLVSNALYRNNT